MQAIPGDLLSIDRKGRAKTPSFEVALRAASERVCDFDEVQLPFTPEQAVFEAARCIHCPDPAPCVRACPAGNDIPSAMWFIEQGRFLDAADLYRQTSSLPEICARVCPHEALCQGSCTMGKHGSPVQTGMLERFVTDYQRYVGEFVIDIAEPTGKQVAVVGAGPSGMACAEQLARRGHAVTLFDALPQPGGLLLYGIPNFKLEKDVVLARMDDLYRMGVKFIGNTFIGRDKTVDDLLAEGFAAVYVAVGTWIDAPMDVEGEDLPGVWKGTEFLMRANVSQAFLPGQMHGRVNAARKVVVIGGGDTASDCLRTALRLGAEEVTCVYRRTEKEMPGGKKDRQMAREEGAVYQFLTQPVRFLAGADGRLAGVECIRMELGEPDASGRRRPVAVEGSNFVIEADTAILTLGYWPDETIGQTTPDLQTQKYGLIVADSQTGQTTRPGVFAGGDAVTGPDLVVTAMVAGRRAARAIDSYLRTEVN